MNAVFRPSRLATVAVLFVAACASAQTGTLAVVPLLDAAQSVATPAVYPDIPGVRIERAEFGVIRDLGSPAALLTPTRVVKRDGRPIGWVIDLRTEKPEVRWREEFVMPVAPEKWGLPPDSTDVRPPMISADRRMATTERRSVPAGGTIDHTWSLDATDPTGPHTMRVYVEDVLVATFEFEVQ